MTPVSIRWRITSSTKNGLPSVSSWTVPTRPAGASCPACEAISAPTPRASRPASETRSNEPVAAQVGEQLGERVLAADLAVAVGADDQQRRLLRRPDDVAQQVQRGAVGPVQVVEDEHAAARAPTTSASSAETASKSR